MNRNAWLAALGTLAAAAILVVLLIRPEKLKRPAAGAARPLWVYCAAGVKLPVEAAAREYEQACHVPVQLQFGGSGTLLSNLRVARAGDLYLAADESYLRLAREFGLLAETVPLARQRPVIAVARHNPRQIRTLADLQRREVRVATANPDAASIGRTVRELLVKAGQWAALAQHVTVFKPTVNDVANDVKLGAVDAGIVWDATARQYPELAIVTVPLFDAATETISIGVLKSSRQPAAALRFARYLGARDKGLKAFERYYYEPVHGDEWADMPEVVLFRGAGARQGPTAALILRAP